MGLFASKNNSKATAAEMGCISCGAPVRAGRCSNSDCSLYPGNCTDCPVCHGVRFKGTCQYAGCASNGGKVDYR